MLCDLGLVVGLAGSLAIVAGTLASVSDAARPAAIRGWWTMLAVGAALALTGVLLSLLLEGVGGAVRAAGGVLAVVAVAFALPR